MTVDSTVYAQRRQRFLAQLPSNSVALVPAANLKTRSNDTEFPFRQDSYFYYLTGFTEPDAWLLLSNLAGRPQSVMFCLPTDKQAEIWHGRRLGVDAAVSTLGVDDAHSVDDFSSLTEKYIDGADYLYYRRDTSKHDQLVFAVLDALRNAPKQSKTAPRHLSDPSDILDEMRLIKDPYEIALMREAAKISVAAHQRAMVFCRPGCHEYQLEAELHHEFVMSGARAPAYGTIVGSGDNACILHYTENSDVINDGELVLIDAGAEYHGYAADITRTFPANGRYSPEQKRLYELVLAAQEAAINLILPGSKLIEAADAAIKVLTEGLVELGILAGTVEENIETKAYREYYMHGLGHWLGLDVHDVGDYKVDDVERDLLPGMVLTIEPGLYISPDAQVDDKWKGIGIRIEDNILVTELGNENLTSGLVKLPQDIEALMAGG
ncbi:MAG: Xaa-Pro aminopeptidase [Aestuariibacter sp.]